MIRTQAHKQSANLVAVRAIHQNPTVRAAATAQVLECWDKIEQVVAATGTTAQVATGYLQAEEWGVSGAVETLLADRMADLQPAKPEFKVETLHRVQTEIVSPVDLKVGDRVIQHGAQLEVAYIRSTMCGGDLVAACISRVIDGQMGSIPRSYLDSRDEKILAGHLYAVDLPDGLYWNVQGNSRARVERIVKH